MKADTDSFPENKPGAGGNLVKVVIAGPITMVGVSTVFMTQSIFLELARSFGLEFNRVHIVFSVASLFYGASFFLLGPLRDTFNLPKAAVSGLAVLTASLFWASLTSHFGIFLPAMALVGFSAAVVPVSMFPHVTSLTPPEKQGGSLGALVAAATTGFILGRVAMGVLTDEFGWRVAFRVYASALMFLTAITWFGLVNKGPQKQQSPPAGLFRQYAKAVRIMLGPETLSLYLTGFGLFFGALGVITFLTYRLTAAPFHFSSAQIGYISFAGLTALIAPFAGDLSRKVEPVKLIVSGLTLCLFALQLMGWFESTLCIILGVFFMFLGVYSCQPLLYLLIARSVPRTPWEARRRFT